MVITPENADIYKILIFNGFNNFQSLNEQSKTAWSEVLNQYQRQALDTARCAPRTLTWRSALWLASADARPREEGR